LRSDVKEVDDVVQVGLFVRLVNLVRAIAVRIHRTLVAKFVDGFVEVSVVLDVNVGNFESSGSIGHVSKELSARHVETVAGHADRIGAHQDSLLGGVPSSA